MEVVINIPDAAYESMQNGRFDVEYSPYDIIDIIKNGKVISKLNRHEMRDRRGDMMDRSIDEYISAYQSFKEAEDARRHEVSRPNQLLQREYQRGLKDAWECARRIGQCSQTDLQDIGFVIEKEVDKNGVRLDWNPSFYVINKYSASEAMQRIADYEQREAKKREGGKFVRIRAEQLGDDRRPYFSIDYTENGEEHNGYGSYSFDIVLDYKSRYFNSN